MRNPIKHLRIPKYKDYPKEFNHFYKIKRIRGADSSKEFLGLGQEYRNSCFIACIRSVLLNDFNISFSKENKLISLAEDIYEKRHQLLGKEFGEEYQIKKHGTYLLHARNIADFFKLKSFASNAEKIEDMIYLLDDDITPIIFRPLAKRDKDGHYVVAYNHDKEKIHIFDPAFRGKRPRDNYPHKGQYKKIPFDKFIEKWHNEYLHGGYVFLCDKDDKPKKKLSGYYMT